MKPWPPSPRAAALTLLSLLPGAAAAPAWEPSYRPTLTIERAAGPIAIDGQLEDPGWQGAARAGGFVEHEPGDQTRPPVDTEVLVAYDDEHLYVAFICQDDPRLVRASLCERDRIWNDDYVIVALDTYGHQQWAYEICANPYGVQGDLMWSAARGEDLSYDLIFRTAARVTPDGWQAEFAIPFASLRFPRRAQQMWRVDFWRNHPRRWRGQYSWAAYDRDHACWPCQWGTLLGISDVRPGRGLELIPAFTATQAGARAADGAFVEGRVQGEPSFAARYAPASNLAMEATLNPDFSQVESDAAQIDVNSTFALSYPEKRPFFQEGGDLFGSPFAVIYTRAINEPLAAAKVIGRSDRASLVALSARDERTPLLLPFAEASALLAGGRSTAHVVRARRSLGQQSHLGLVATDRRLDGGGAGTVGGLDGQLRLGRTTELEFQALLSWTVEPDDAALSAPLADLTFDRGRRTAALDGERFGGHALHASFERDGRAWSLDADYWERSPTFRADLGFEPRNDQRLVSVRNQYLARRAQGLVEWVAPSVMVARMWDFADARKDEWIWASLTARLRAAQTQVSVRHMRSDELFGGQRFDGIQEWGVSFNSTPVSWISGQVDGSRGHRIARRELAMGRETSLAAAVDLRPLDRLRVEGSFRYTRSDDLDTGARLFSGHIARARLNLQVTHELSARLVVQHNEFARVWDLDPLVTYRLSPFSIFYVGSTRDHARFPADDGGESWKLAARTWFLKLQYLWRP